MRKLLIFAVFMLAGLMAVPSHAQTYTTSKKFLGVDNSALSEMARVTKKNMDELVMDWMAKEHYEYMRVWDSALYGPSQEERKNAPAKWSAKQKDVANKFMPEAKKLSSQANDIRIEILSRLPTASRSDLQDKKAEVLFSKIGDLTYSDISAQATYLESLRNRLP